jgi:hypothetical protein
LNSFRRDRENSGAVGINMQAASDRSFLESGSIEPLQSNANRYSDFKGE